MIYFIVNIRTDARHLYLQVIDILRQNIKEGIYKEGEKLPSESILATQMGVSRATLREALRILEEDHTITRRHGIGTFVNKEPISLSGIEELSSVTDMIKDAGLEPGTIYLNKVIETLSNNERKKLACSKSEEVIKVDRVRTADGKPVVYCIDKIPLKYFPNDFTTDDLSLFHILERNGKRKITQAVAEITPIGYDDKVSPILECDPETALLVLKQLYFDEESKPVFYSINYFKADTFQFHVIRKRI